MSKRDLQRAVRGAGGVSSLARRLGVHASTVSRWLRDGVPKRGSARQLLAEHKAAKAAERASKKSDRQTFEELMKLAGEAGKLPTLRSADKGRSGPKTSGHMWTRLYNRMLSLGLIDDAEAWMLGLQRRYPIWQAVVIISQYGKGQHKGYSTVYFQLSPEAGDFAIESTIATPRTKSKPTMAGAVRDALEDLAIDSSTTTFVHGVTVYNYRMRTEQERRAWETRQRQKRQKKPKLSPSSESPR